MKNEMRTKRRWLQSVLEAVAETSDARVALRSPVRQAQRAQMPAGQKGFALRLKAATRPLAEAAR